MDHDPGEKAEDKYQLSRRGALVAAGIAATLMSGLSTFRATPAYAANYIWPVPPNGPGGTYTFDPEGDWGPRQTAPSPHNGLDFQRLLGTSIWAIAGGQVAAKSQNSANALGNWIQINHQNGVWSRYGHFRSPTHLNVGDWVSQGDVVGYMGNTGTYSTGVHLHLDIMVGSAGIGSRVDPQAFLRDSGAGDTAPSEPVEEEKEEDEMFKLIHHADTGAIWIVGASGSRVQVGTVYHVELLQRFRAEDSLLSAEMDIVVGYLQQVA